MARYQRQSALRQHGRHKIVGVVFIAHQSDKQIRAALVGSGGLAAVGDDAADGEVVLRRGQVQDAADKS